MDNNVLFVVLLSEYFKNKEKKIKKRNKKMWVKLWLQNRKTESAYNRIFAELRLHDQEEFRRYLRMNTATYQVT